MVPETHLCLASLLLPAPKFGSTGFRPVSHRQAAGAAVRGRGLLTPGLVPYSKSQESGFVGFQHLDGVKRVLAMGIGADLLGKFR
jgi:hypothetical protein